MQRILVDQNDITKTRVESVTNRTLEQGEVRLKLESFALTANNVTYAASGFSIGYWKFFPTDVSGQGLVPVWGHAAVSESRPNDLPVGTRLYGFFPMAEELIITPRVSSRGGVTDVAAHRTDLPAVYNRYRPVSNTSVEDDHLKALLQPLLATSYLLSDWLDDNDFFGAEQIIVGSASSKTGLGLCKYLAERKDRPYSIIGLTSATNKAFVEGLEACDTVLNYNEIGKIPEISSVFVDMAGNAQVKSTLHSHLKDHMRHSAAVGTSHWDAFKPKVKLEGVKPKFFFAPAQIAKRRDEWGPGEIDLRIEEAVARIVKGASDWMEVKVHHGLEAAPAVYADLAHGKTTPNEGHIIQL